MLSLDPRKCERKEIWLTISQADGVAVLLHAVLKKHEDEFTEFLESSKYQSDVGLITLASPISERSGAVEVNDVPEQQNTYLLPKKEFELAIVVGRHRRSCTRNLSRLPTPSPSPIVV